MTTDKIFECECGWKGTVNEMNHRSDSGEWGNCDQHECAECFTVLINDLDTETED